ncbi:MAG TPA: error-prone DNA polymerase [Alphaproteobacteria bacterium]
MTDRAELSYAELQVTSNFSFLRGGSHPAELVRQAAVLGHRAIAITDRNTLAGVVRAHLAARECGIKLVVGARLDLVDGPSLLCLPTDRAAYGRLAQLLTLGKRRVAKGECHLTKEDVRAHGAGQIFLVVPPERPDDGFAAELRDFARAFPGACHLVAHHLYRGDDVERIDALAALAERCGTPLVATNDVHYHEPGRRPLQDILTCIREGCTVAEAGYRLDANAERHLKPAAEMARLFRRHPDALRRTVEIAGHCGFSLDSLRYEYPVELGKSGRTPQEELAHRTWRGARRHYRDGVPDKVRKSIERELAFIAEHDYAPYFLTVHNIVRFAKAKRILCQGRGSAANSAVCFCLGITAVDPDKIDLLFERFISAARNEPPDIDVDFEHERREEVIQYIYWKYGRDHAGMTATVIHYRWRRAIREVGKAMGLSPDTVAALARTSWGWSEEGIGDDEVRELGLDPADRSLRLALDLAAALIGFPRHLSQHVGGFVITRAPLSEVVPIENAAMEDRTVIEWDKDDLDIVGMFKIDVLALGMLTCIRKAFQLIEQQGGPRYTLATVPQEDPAVYDMLCRADAVGVFQVESRAQMSMLPRLRPRKFYDLVVEVAIVRPGPIQGDMVHPYLRRRDGKEPIDIPSPELEAVLKNTYGVPLFQEQAMRIAIVGAGFTAEKADRLRRAMATFRQNGTIHQFEDDFIRGMVENGYARDFAVRCFNQIKGFGEYGFPESHAASFAQLAYVSAWLKCHHPAIFACALLNSQPMGFYAPAQIVRDARDHGVEVRPVDVNLSQWDCTIESAAGSTGGLAVRLGFRQIKGFAEADAKKLVAARGIGYGTPHELARRAGLTQPALERLARADAWGSAGLDRRTALWATKGVAGAAPPPLLAAAEADEGRADLAVRLPTLTLGEQVVEDYATLFLSLKAHPAGLLRPRLARNAMIPAGRLASLENGDPVRLAGLVLVRQRPGTAKGVIFITLEDETGVANLVVWPKIFERYRRVVLTSKLLAVEGTVQREGMVIHIVAHRLVDLSAWLDALHRRPSPFDGALARADQVKRPVRDQDRPLYPSRDFH